MGPVLKTGEGLRLPRVRILLHPLLYFQGGSVERRDDEDGFMNTNERISSGRARLDFFRFSLAQAILILLVLHAQFAMAQGRGSRVRNVSRAIQTIPNSLMNQTLRPSGGDGRQALPLESLFPDPALARSFATYRVGVTNVSWRSRAGKNYTALVYHPTSQPISGSKFGAIVYSHGLGSSPDEFAYLGRAWAARGVVAIMLHHPESDASVWRGRMRPMSALKDAYHKYWNGRDRALAIRSAIDFIYASHNSPGPMGADLDLSRIAVAGNDLGALGALLVAGQAAPDNGASLRDDRVRAVLALSPPVYCEAAQGDAVYSDVVAPLMVVTGTEDDGIVGKTKAYQRRIPYDSVKHGDRYLVVLNGGDHRVYGSRRVGQQGDQSFHETIAFETTDFLAAYLLGDFGTLTRLREYGATAALNNATVERRLVPLQVDAFETEEVGASSL